MNIQWSICDAVDFGEHASAWDDLNRRGRSIPFLDSLFVRPLLEVFGTGGEKLALGSRDGRLVAAAILSRAGWGRWASFQPSQMPLGPLLAAPELALDEVAESLAGSLPGLTLGLGLTQLDPLLNARPAGTEKFATLDYIQTAWVDIDQDFETYWAARGKNLKQNMRKQRNKLAADGVALSLEVLETPASVDEALRQYGELETASWKAAEGTAVALANAQGRFYAEMLHAFCAAGRGRIYRYRFDDKVVAMDLCIESDGLLVILKTAYDGSNKSLSPAFLMREEQFQRLFAEGRVRRIEFYGKLMEWHTRWTDNSRTLFHANAYPHAWVPRLLALWTMFKGAPKAAERGVEAEQNA